jgi:hypothetical protein
MSISSRLCAWPQSLLLKINNDGMELKRYGYVDFIKTTRQYDSGARCDHKAIEEGQPESDVLARPSWKLSCDINKVLEVRIKSLLNPSVSKHSRGMGTGELLHTKNHPFYSGTRGENFWPRFVFGPRYGFMGNQDNILLKSSDLEFERGIVEFFRVIPAYVVFILAWMYACPN